MSRYVSEPGSLPTIKTGGEPRAPFFNRCVYDTPGTYCFTVPSGVCTIRVVTVGAGGPSCRRIGPDEEYLRPLSCPGEPERIICGHDGFHHKIVTCVRPLSSCADYCNCGACGSYIQMMCCLNCSTSICCLYSTSCGSVCLKTTNGVAGAGTTIYYESCYMSGQSIIGPSGGYADGCLSVTPGCSFTVTVGCAGGSSGFGTFISATGGSVAITQRPKVRCHPYHNACYLACGTDGASTPVSIASSTFICCTFYLSNSTHCFSHTYQNCCALATLTAGVGTAWSGMCNVIVRSGAAGTIFHPSEYSFKGCITGPSGITGSCQMFTNTTSPSWCSCITIGTAGTSNNTFCIDVANSGQYFGYGCSCESTYKPTITDVCPSTYILRCWGGASAGNYFGNGINQSNYDIVSTCVVTQGALQCASFNSACTGQHSYHTGPLLPCCVATLSSFRTCACNTCCGCYNLYFLSNNTTGFIYGSPGGAGIKSPGTRTLSGSGRACCTCALICGAGSASLCYRPTDDVNGIFEVVRVYPPACCCGVICCNIVPNSIVGSDYWYPEDMNGHSSICYSIGPSSYSICGQPGAGSNYLSCFYQPGVLGGSTLSYCTSSNIATYAYLLSSSCCTLCGGGTSGFDTHNIFNGACLGTSSDCRCQNFSRGLVIVYY